MYEETILSNNDGKLNVDVIRKTVNSLFQPHEMIEIRIIGETSHPYGQFFTADDIGQISKMIEKHDGKDGIYVTLNPVKNSVDCDTGKLTKDIDIEKRKWLLIDLDPVRPSKTSATNEQIDEAKQRAEEVRNLLQERGFPKPLVGFSGNGIHLLYGVELPNDEDSLRLIGGCLDALAYQFSDERIKIDTIVKNASRVTRFYGTINVKGDIHRRSGILDEPGGITSRESLEQLEKSAPSRYIPMAESGGFNLEKWVKKHFSDNIKKIKTWSGHPFYELQICPFNSEHDRGEAYIGQLDDGKIFAGCHHNSCEWNWKELRKKYEPDAYKKRNRKPNG